MTSEPSTDQEPDTTSEEPPSDRASTPEDHELYRRRFLKADARRAAAVLVAVSGLLGLTLINDYRLFGFGRTFLILVGVRVAAIAGCLGGLLVIRRSRIPRVHDRAITISLVLGVAATAYTLSTRPPGYIGFAVATTLGLTLYYFVLPGPLAVRAAAAIALSVVTLWQALRGPTPPIGLTAVIIVHVLTHFIGIPVARWMERLRRNGFYAELDERRAREELARKARDLECAKNRAETLARAKSEFLATMSHELRTPMNAVLGLSSLLADAPLDPEHKDMVRTIHTSARSLLVFFDDILDLAKVDAGRMTLQEAPFEVRSVVQSAADVVRHQAEEKGLSLRVDISPEVPTALLGDAHRVRQILLNLLSNAVKFTRTGSVELYVHAPRPPDSSSPPSTKGEVVFTVTDTGPGIPPDVLSTLFTPFEQGPGARAPSEGGTGLGLAISKQLALLMGGDIRASSRPGHGSTFELTLRAAAATLVAAPRAALPPPSELASLRILLVEDNAINQRVASAMLARLGCRPDIVESGAAALQAVTAEDYDLIFMDLRMPDMDGIETTRRIRAALPPARAPHIFAMSASAFESDRAACTEAGMDGFVSKPVSLEDLGATLKRVALLKSESASVQSPALRQ